MKSAEELRADTRRLHEAANNVGDPVLKSELATLALELAQRAEALTRFAGDSERLRASIDRYHRLLAERVGDPDQQRVIKQFLKDAEDLLAHLTADR